jgi:hypothetical protein
LHGRWLHEEERTMRCIALWACAFTLIACSSESTGQTSAAIKGSGEAPVTGSGDGSVNGGCTYTQGYWKTHPSAWPVTSLTIGGVAYSEQQLLGLFNTAPAGDASLILGHQLIAALLNTASGAAPSAAVQQAINDAQTWMATNLGSSGHLPYGVSAGSAAGQQATALTQSLDTFNSGLAGTAHCGTGSSSGGGSSGGSGSGGSSSGGSGPDSGSGCVPSGVECIMNSECCSGACGTGGVCAGQ